METLTAVCSPDAYIRFQTPAATLDDLRTASPPFRTPARIKTPPPAADFVPKQPVPTPRQRDQPHAAHCKSAPLADRKTRDFEAISELHFKLEVAERRIQDGLDPVHDHPAMAIHALEDFQFADISAAEKKLKARYVRKQPHEVCPTFWKPRIWDSPDKILTETESLRYRERICKFDTDLADSGAKWRKGKSSRERKFASSSDDEFELEHHIDDIEGLPSLRRKSKRKVTRSAAPLPIVLPSPFFATDDESDETDFTDF
jgi:hypothetical protein